MLIRKAALAGVLTFYAVPALAEIEERGHKPTPKSLTTFAVADQSIEVLAVTRRARADTRFHRDYLEDSADMSGFMPGYPQPAIVSFDLRLNF